jgi:hypothetical protein
VAIQKWSIGGVAILAAICLFALFVAFVVGPAISHASGVADEYVSLALGAVFLVIAVAATLGAKALNKKNAAE